ncbi:MAG: T9SS type A sorting domain-containing protein, partial [Paludibacteraceae bacterium]|nr:T9SS type A sorting domain-containing protein [Paludibacteraceae bacterium]
DCQLYNVTIEIEDLVGGSVGESLTEAGEYGVKLYPNPSNGNFTISTSETIESIEILNVMGQAVAVSSDANINITLSAGTYFVKVVTAEGNSYIEKMIVK